jgi:hypothetical protein
MPRFRRDILWIIQKASVLHSALTEEIHGERVGKALCCSVLELLFVSLFGLLSGGEPFIGGERLRAVSEALLNLAPVTVLLPNEVGLLAVTELKVQAGLIVLSFEEGPGRAMTVSMASSKSAARLSRRSSAPVEVVVPAITLLLESCDPLLRC